VLNVILDPHLSLIPFVALEAGGIGTHVSFILVPLAVFTGIFFEYCPEGQVLNPSYKGFQTNLCVKWYITANTSACVAATIYLEPLLGSDKRMPGVKTKNRTATYNVHSIFIFLINMGENKSCSTLKLFYIDHN